ncbi:MAG: hypothetical protein QM706_18085 [Nitrospira sp.]
MIVGSFDVAWQNALADVGPAGEDKGKGGKYLILAAGLQRKESPTVIIVLQSETRPRIRDPAFQLQEPQRRRYQIGRRAR